MAGRTGGAGAGRRTGIRTLKIKYNKVFGYYLEVTNSFKDLVPDYYTENRRWQMQSVISHPA